MKPSIPLLFLTLCVTIQFLFSNCGNRAVNDAGKPLPQEKAEGPVKQESLPDTPVFVVWIDNKKYAVDADKVTAYMGSDSALTIYGKTVDTSGVQLVIPLKTTFPFTVSTGYSSFNTKIAFSEEQAVLPTVILNNYPHADVSFNNLDDGYHKKDTQPGAITVTELKKLENDDPDGSTHQVKGYVHTTVLKNVYAGKDKDYNRDYKLEGQFVVRFRTY